jgi:glycosyltransferase involved in cell wall biosynthesis
MTFSRVPGLVSVVVPNYNKASYIEECLNSIRQQSYSKWELIIVDDASTDSSRSRILHWHDSQQQKDGFTVLFLPRNTGYSGALTTGYFLARGEFIAVQDSDDRSHPDRLMKQVAFLQANPGIDVVGTNYLAFNDQGKTSTGGDLWLKYGSQIPAVYRDGGHCVCHGTIMFRAALFDEFGGLTRKYTGAEDYEFIARCITRKRGIENIRDVLYYYRVHPEQRSHQFYLRKDPHHHE